MEQIHLYKEGGCLSKENIYMYAYICIYKNAIKIFVQRHKHLFKLTHIISEKAEEYF